MHQDELVITSKSSIQLLVLVNYIRLIFSCKNLTFHRNLIRSYYEPIDIPMNMFDSTLYLKNYLILFYRRNSRLSDAQKNARIEIRAF